MMNKKYFLPLIFALTSVLYIACDDKRCDDVVCGLNEQCRDGNCYCEDGYEGDFCDEFSYLKYQGTYNVSMSCQSPIAGFYSFETIYSDQSPINEITFQNFLNQGFIKGYIGSGADNEGNLVVIPQQNLGSTATLVAGEGYFQEFGGGGQLHVNIQIAQNGQSTTCSIIYYKQ